MPVALSEQAFRDNPVSTRRLVSKPALTVLNGLQPYADGHGPSGPREHPLPLIKEIADSDKHRVLTGSFGEADLAGIGFLWNSTVASGPRHDLVMTPGTVIDSTRPVVRIRFQGGNADANVRVERQPTFALLFETDNWTVPFEKVGESLRWAYLKLLTFVPLFPTN